MIQYCHKDCQNCGTFFVCSGHEEGHPCVTLCEKCEGVLQRKMEENDLAFLDEERLHYPKEDFYDPIFLGWREI